VSTQGAGSVSRSHRTLGMLWLIFGVLRILGATWMVLDWGALTVMWGALLNRVPEPLIWMTTFHVFLTAAVVFYILLGILSILTGFFLLGRPPSAGTVVIIASILAVMSGPLGVALGVPTLVFFLPRSPAQT
jgi:hypothetical protein